MNGFSCFLFVMVLCVRSSDGKLFGENLVQFKNSLNPGKQIKISCTLNKKEQFQLFMDPGETYDYKFHGKYLLKNKMDCQLTQGVLGDVLFRAYEGASGIFDHGKQNFWDVREDGVYFTHGKETPKLEYKWIPKSFISSLF
ncbi:hypothetical protein CARUB_v10002986mg [Capsella rubella]|uniref:Uncharacterized protein n=1 Tax=Capsella rubella TaxID=81985 RepID=R0FCU5_9BRAS|nr:hypothetical protein CARUB_v10002986mg [Capsella rubella]